MQNKWTLIKEVKRKGGLFAAIADDLQNEDDAEKFIIMCFEQCHNDLAVEMWGNRLILKIVNCRLELLRKGFEKVIGRKYGRLRFRCGKSAQTDPQFSV